MAKPLNLRARIALTLSPLLNRQGSLASVLPKALEQTEERDRALLQQICYGTFRYWPQLNLLSEQMLRKPFREEDQDLRVLLMTGLYQLAHLAVAPHAVINETVEACRQLNKEWAGKLINAVLRRYQRESVELNQALQDKPGYRWNHPDWMIAKLQHNWPEHWQAVLRSNDDAPPFCLRINRQKTDRDTYLQRLAEQNIEASAGQYSSDAIYLKHPCPVSLLPGFADGWVSVQDEAAQLAAGLIQAQPGDRILDACAAPGGKLCHLLEINSDIEVDAVELDARRAERIDQNLSRLQLNARVILGDASQRDWWQGEHYDRILIDAPCSATGVIRRNPDIKALRSNEEIVKLAGIQLAILNNLWDLLKPGGTLLYATCSVFPQENERVIERFLKEHQDARHDSFDCAAGITRPFGQQLFAQQGGHDGFYYARLKRAMEA